MLKVPFVKEKAPDVAVGETTRVFEKFDAVVGEAVVLLKIVDDTVVFEEVSKVWKELGSAFDEAVALIAIRGDCVAEVDGVTGSPIVVSDSMGGDDEAMRASEEEFVMTVGKAVALLKMVNDAVMLDEVRRVWEDTGGVADEAVVVSKMRDDCIADIDEVIGSSVVEFSNTARDGELDPNVLSRPLISVVDAVGLLGSEDVCVEVPVEASEEVGDVVEEFVEDESDDASEDESADGLKLSEVFTVDRVELRKEVSVGLDVAIKKLAEVLMIWTDEGENEGEDEGEIAVMEEDPLELKIDNTKGGLPFATWNGRV